MLASPQTTSNESNRSKVSHLTNKNQFCIKNFIEGEVVVSDEIIKCNNSTISDIVENENSLKNTELDEVKVEITDKISKI